jgi:hypothetical protein
LENAEFENHEGGGNITLREILEKQVVRAGGEWNWLRTA